MEPGREVTIGVRPEHLTLSGAADSALRGTVEMIEQLGADTLVHVAADKAQVIARLPHGVAPEVGSTVTLAADPSRVYVFDRATGTRIR
jgi:ABC-type sugar transport system ATPase subunit